MKLAAPTIVVCATVLSACAGFILAPVSDGDRDTMNTYDGRWNMKIASRSTFPKSKSDRNQFRCDIVANTYILNVTDGIASIEGMESEANTNVAADGIFRLEIPTDEKFRKQNGLSGIGSSLTYVYKGSLSMEESVGAFVHARGEAKNTRCSTTMAIKKLS